LRRKHGGAKPDRRLICATLLTWFFDLYQHAARPFAAECRAPPQEFVGPFYGFDAKDEALLNDDCLADIKGANCTCDA
jgi:hypothetical protein